MAERNKISQPLPEKIAALLHEARWLFVGALAGFLALTLWGYDKADPGWSHAALADHIVNPGGKFGAWLADLMLYLFGLSAWWWVVCLLLLLVWGYRRHRAFRALGMLLFGLVALWAGVLYAPLHEAVVPHAIVMTVGGMLVGLAHLLNLRLNHWHIHDASCAH